MALVLDAQCQSREGTDIPGNASSQRRPGSQSVSEWVKVSFVHSENGQKATMEEVLLVEGASGSVHCVEPMTVETSKSSSVAAQAEGLGSVQCEFGSATEYMDGRKKSKVDATDELDSNEAVSELTRQFELGSMVEVEKYGFGVVQWLGELGGKKMAGVELVGAKRTVTTCSRENGCSLTS